LSESCAADLSNVEVKVGDVLFNNTGDSVLRTCVVEPFVLSARVNQHVAIIRAVDGVPSHYLHLYIVQPRVKEFLLGLSAGATRPAELFQTTPQNVTLHLKAIFAEGELSEAATCKDYLQVRREGGESH
jgi:hypothetical protein